MGKMDKKEVVIENLEQLLTEISEGELGVDWRVLPSIGPDWIGGGRFVRFYLDGEKLAKNEFHQFLADTLIKKLDIPAVSHDDREVLFGEGDIIEKDGNLNLEYHWYKTMPYMHHHDSGGGEITLLEL